MDYIRKACNTLFIKNGKQSSFPDYDLLISSALCDKNSIKCIMRVCSMCKTFPKIDALAISSLKCIKSCYKENKDCTKHTIKVRQFERVVHNHGGQKLNKFPVHRFNIQQTAKTYDKIIANFSEHSILKIHDFSENYACLLPEEIQSVH